MKKLKLFLTLLTLVIFGSGQMWGDQITIGYENSQFSPALPTSGGNNEVTAHTAYSLAIAEKGIYKGGSNNYLMFVKDNGYLYNTSSLGTITKVEVTYSSGTSTSGKAGVYFGTTAQSTYTTTSNTTIKGQSKTDEWTNSTTGKGFFQLSTSNKNVQITQIVITYTPASCSDDPTVGNIMNNVSSITASGATFTTSAGVSAGTNCTLSEVGFVYGTSTQPTITSGTKAVIANYESGNLSKAVTGLTEGTHYYVRAYATNGHGTVYSDEKEFDTPELAKYTVSFNTGAGNSAVASETEASVGAGITLPGGPASIKASGWTFAGWAETVVSEETTTEPTLLSGTYYPTHDCSLYAVYRKTSDEYTTKTVDLVANDGAFNTDHITFSALNGTMTLTQIKSSTTSTAVNSSYYKKGTDSNRPRVYKGHSLKIESTNFNISKVEITCNGSYYGNDITSATSIESDGTVTDDTDAITKDMNYSNGGTHSFTVEDEDGVSGVYVYNSAATSNTQLHLKSVVVSYLEAEVIYYSTPCQKLPTITPSVQDATQSGITVKWTSSSDVTNWNVQFKVQGADDNTYADVTIANPATDKTVSGGFNLWKVSSLQAGTTYTFKIVATAFGNGVCTDVNTWTVDGATENNYEVTAQSNNTNYGTVVLSGSTITATPAEGYRVSKTTPYEVSVENAVNVAQDGNVFTISNLSSSCTITINFEAIPTYAVNWYVNGVSQKEKSYREGTLVSTIMADAPSVLDNALTASCGSTKFIGWVTEAYTGNEGTISTYNNSKVDGEATLSAAANYYAMFATATTDEWNRVDALNAITAGTYVIVNDGHALPNTTTSSAPSYGTAVTVDGTTHKITSTVAANMQWNFTGTTSAMTITNATGDYLYVAGTSNNNQVRVGSTNHNWTIAENTTAPAYSLKDNSNNRYCATYSEQDWRSYNDAAHNNYGDGGKVYLYKHSVIYGEYRTGCTCNTVTVAVGTHTNGTLTLDDDDKDVSHETCTASSVEVRVAPNATYQFAATNAVTFNMGTTGLTAPSSYETDGDARVYTISIPKGTAEGTITVSAAFEQLPSYTIDLSGITLATAASSPSGEALGGATVTLSYSNLTSGYTFLGWSVVGDDSGDPIAVNNNLFTMPQENVTVTANIVPNVSVAFYVGTTPYGEPAVTYQGGTISLPSTDPTESFDATNYPNFVGWSATNFGAATSAPALVDGSETINASTSYYAVFADKDPAVMTDNYQKIAYTSSLGAGNYVLAAYKSSESKYYAMTATYATNDSRDLVGTEVTVGEGEIINTPNANCIWAISTSAGKVKLYNANTEKYAQVVLVDTYKNLLLTASDSHNEFTISENNSNVGAYKFTTTETGNVANYQIEYYNTDGKYKAFSSQDAPIYLFKQLAQVPTKWATKQIAEVTVSFYDNVAEEDITVPANQVVESGNNSIDLTSEDLKPGARAGYQFSGWSLTANGNVEASLSNITQNTPLYAIWAPNPNCTIKFSVRGTVKEALQETVLQGLTYSGFASKEIAEADEVDGYDFIGWAAAEQTKETTTTLVPMTTFTPDVEDPVAASEKVVYAIFKRSTDAVEVTDEITYENLEAGGSSYEDFEYTSTTSGVVYAGNTAAGNSSIQLRSDKSSAGIVSKTSAGKITKVAVEWNSNTSSGRKVGVYASNMAYNDATELYGSATSSLGTIDYESTTEFNIEDEYTFVGIRSTSGALYLNKVSFTWSSSTTYYTTRPTQLWTVTYDLGEGGSWASTSCESGQVQEGEYTVCTINPVNSNENMLFMGWKIGETPITTETINVTGDVTIAAIWKEKASVTVTYNAQGCEGDAPDVQNVKEGDIITVVSNLFTNAGYMFAGWDVYYMDGENHKQTIDLDANNQFKMPAFNVTIAPTWSPKSDDKWTLVTDVNELVAATDGAPQYVIASYEASAGKYYAMGEQRLNNRGAVEVSVTGGTLNGPQAMAIFTLEVDDNDTPDNPDDDKWAIKEAVENGKYLYAAGGGNNMRSQAENDVNGKWTITVATTGEATIVATESENRNHMHFNSNNTLFSCYDNSTPDWKKSVALYRIVNKIVVNGNDVDASDVLPENPAEASDVVVRAGTTLTVNENRTVNDFTVETGATVVIPEGKTLTVKDNVYISATLGSSMSPSTASGIVNAARMAVAENRDVFFDLTLPLNGTSQQWHAFTVPFPVDVLNGIYDLNGNKLTNEVNYAIMEYDSQRRANGGYGWKKIRTTLQPGVFYLMTVDGNRTTYRMKKATGALEASTTMTYQPNNGSSTDDNDKGWNAVGNPNMFNAKVVDKPVHVLDPYAYEYRSVPKNSVISMGMPYFYKANHEGTAGSISTVYDAGTPYYAPNRTQSNEIADLAVNFGNATYKDVMYISASEDALNSYEYDKDLVKLRMSSTPRVAQIIGKAYGKTLSMVYAPLTNNQAVYDIDLYTPAAGTYSLSAAAIEGADLYVTYEGQIVWNLSLGDYELDLTKGTTTGYGLLLVVQPNQMPTGIEDGESLNGENGVQKILLNGNLYILRDGHLYDAVGHKK